MLSAVSVAASHRGLDVDEVAIEAVVLAERAERLDCDVRLAEEQLVLSVVLLGDESSQAGHSARMARLVRRQSPVSIVSIVNLVNLVRRASSEYDACSE